MSDNIKQITIEEYDELYLKSSKYDHLKNRRQAGGRKSWSKLTAAQKTKRAKKMVNARIEKYHQNKRA